KECLYCEERSFHGKNGSEMWSKKNPMKPREIRAKSHETVLFKCNVCFHKFKSIVSNMTKGNGCPFCAKSQLCDDENCLRCEIRSFHGKYGSELWSEENKKKPREVFHH